jgi:hypothetical protein
LISYMVRSLLRLPNVFCTRPPVPPPSSRVEFPMASNRGMCLAHFSSVSAFAACSNRSGIGCGT